MIKCSVWSPAAEGISSCCSAQLVPSHVGSSYMSTGPASSSLTPVVPASAHVPTRVHGCGVWSEERFKDTQLQTLLSLSLSLSVLFWPCCTLIIVWDESKPCHCSKVDSSNSSGLAFHLHIYYSFISFFPTSPCSFVSSLLSRLNCCLCQVDFAFRAMCFHLLPSVWSHRAEKMLCHHGIFIKHS